ncbi:hypothetical protein IQ07DRAFT_372662 [Pyrenochaeta sp. DS3sAY3a]|nr:hypothetical protein IQ07DRAFT_372662 [Pyrenochaeta sp. DS3sAY3a]
MFGGVRVDPKVLSCRWLQVDHGRSEESKTRRVVIPKGCVMDARDMLRGQNTCRGVWWIAEMGKGTNASPDMYGTGTSWCLYKMHLCDDNCGLGSRPLLRNESVRINLGLVERVWNCEFSTSLTATDGHACVGSQSRRDDPTEMMIALARPWSCLSLPGRC